MVVSRRRPGGGTYEPARPGRSTRGLREVAVGQLDEIRDEIGGVVETIGEESIAQAGESRREEHDDEVAELGLAGHARRHRLLPIGGRITSGCFAQ